VSQRSEEQNGRALRAVAFVPYPLGATPSQRFRLEQWAPRLKERGIEIEFRPFATAALAQALYRPGAFRKAVALTSAMARHARRLPRPGEFDVAIVHRGMMLAGPPYLERRLARILPVVYDFDDAIHLLHTSEANRAFGWLKFPGKTAAICALATSVTVGNEYLKAFAMRHAPRVDVVPSSVDTDVYTPGPPASRASKPVVGWMGSSTSQTYLEPFASLLERMVSAGFVLRLVSDRRPAFTFPFEWKPWSASEEVQDLRDFDVGIMPLPDTEWAKGKCAMKILQYMGVGVPSMGSALGGNLEVIADGRNGFLADSADEWMSKLTRLTQDAELARRIGAAGRTTVLERYSATVCADRFADVLRRAAGNAKHRGSIA